MLDRSQGKIGVAKMYAFLTYIILFCVLFMSGNACSTTYKRFHIVLHETQKSIIVSPHEPFELKIEAQLGTGYGWYISQKDDFIKLVKEGEVETRDTHLLGGIDYQVFRLVAEKEQEGTVIFHYRQPWKDKKKVVRILTVHVHSDMKSAK